MKPEITEVPTALHAAAMAAKSFTECALFTLDHPDSSTATDTLPKCRERLEQALAALNGQPPRITLGKV